MDVDARSLFQLRPLRRGIRQLVQARCLERGGPTWWKGHASACGNILATHGVNLDLRNKSFLASLETKHGSRGVLHGVVAALTRWVGGAAVVHAVHVPGIYV